MSSQNEQIKLDFNDPSDALKLLNSMLNKAAKSGAYSIDESFVIRLSLNALDKLIRDGTDKTNQDPTKTVTI